MATRKRPKKKTVRRKSATRRGKPKPFPQWVLLGAGLVAGILIAGLVQLVITRTSEPDSGLRSLVNQKQGAQKTSATKKTMARQSPGKETLVRHFDFYTILPEIETVLPDSGTPESYRAASARPDKNVRYVLQAGSFSNFDDADRLKARLVINNLEAHVQKITIENKGVFHRVRLGPYDKLKDLDKTSRQLKRMGIPALRLSVKQTDNR